MKLVLLDIDGTLTDTNDVDTSCFVRALADVFGISNVNTDWSAYPDATDSALTANLVKSQLGRLPCDDEIVDMRESLYLLLNAALTERPKLCQAIRGGPQFLRWLSNASDCAVAFATGGWRHTARLKLEMAGYDHAGIPMASADDAHRRVDICSIAVRRSLEEQHVPAFDPIVYFGDGVWDARAAADLGYGFVGIADGRGAELLKDEGVGSVIPDFDSADFPALLNHLSH